MYGLNTWQSEPPRAGYENLWAQTLEFPNICMYFIFQGTLHLTAAPASEFPFNKKLSGKADLCPWKSFCFHLGLQK